jgi:hypothetical protein
MNRVRCFARQHLNFAGDRLDANGRAVSHLDRDLGMVTLRIQDQNSIRQNNAFDAFAWSSEAKPGKAIGPYDLANRALCWGREGEWMQNSFALHPNRPQPSSERAGKRQHSHQPNQASRASTRPLTGKGPEMDVVARNFIQQFTEVTRAHLRIFE